MAVQKHVNIGVVKVRRAVPCKHCHFGVDDVKTLEPPGSTWSPRLYRLRTALGTCKNTDFNKYSLQ